MDIYHRNIKKVKVGAIKERKDKDGRPYYTRQLLVKSGEGRLDEITLFADCYEALKMREHNE